MGTLGRSEGVMFKDVDKNIMISHNDKETCIQCSSLASIGDIICDSFSLQHFLSTIEAFDNKGKTVLMDTERTVRIIIRKNNNFRLQWRQWWRR